MGCNKNNSKREIYKQYKLTSETRKISSKQLNLKHKANWRKKNKQYPKLVEGKKS